MTGPVVIVPAEPPEPAGEGTAFAAGVAAATAEQAAEDAAAAEQAAEDAAGTADLALDIALGTVSRAEYDELAARVAAVETVRAEPVIVVEEFPMSPEAKPTPEPETKEPEKASEKDAKPRYGRDSWFGG